MTQLSCVGCAGAYPFRQELPQQPAWRLMEEHISSALRSYEHGFAILLEQDVLPILEIQPEEHLPLRIVLCGLAWDGETCYGASLESLFDFQAAIDAQGADCLSNFDGDFSLGYVPPDSSMVWLYRSISSTRGIYYRLSQEALTWSTNPADLFAHGRPTLDDVDPEMVAIIAATGLAEPQRTCYKNLISLPAGEGLCLRDGRIMRTIHTEYTYHDENAHLSSAQASRQLREHIEVAVARALHGFSSLNVFLSGGLDTAVIAYEAARLGKNLHGYHWTWDHPIFRDEYARAEALAHQLEVTFHPLDFSSSIAKGGEYLRSTQGLILPYNHAFYYCFARSFAEVASVDAGDTHVIAGGHLGDTLFQGDWADAFRLPRRSPGTLVRLTRDLLSWYPRKQALTSFCYLLMTPRNLEENPSAKRIASNQGILTEWAFGRVLTRGSIDYRDLQSAAWQQRPVSSRMVQASLQSNTEFNAVLETGMTYQSALPHQVVLRHPFSDRRLQEFCLSLAPHHRNRWCAGQNYDKFLLRLAYLGDLPQNVLSREIRTPYAAVSEQFCLQNREVLQEVFGQEALLSHLGIINHAYVQEILAESERCQKSSRSLLRIAAVEMWLQGLTREPRAVRVTSTTERAKEGLPGKGVIALCPWVAAHIINGNCVLIHRRTLQVSRFDDAGMLYWNAFTQEHTWPGVIAFLQERQPEQALEEIQNTVYTFARELVKSGWITLKEEIGGVDAISA